MLSKDSIIEPSVLEMLEPRIAPASLSGGFDSLGFDFKNTSANVGVSNASEGTAGFTSHTDTGAIKVKIASVSPPFGDPEIVSSSELHFLDADGDEVTVKFSKKILGDRNIEDVFHFTESGAGHVLESIDFSELANPGKARNVNIDITVEKSSAHPNSDGVVEVGAILSPGKDLGTVFIEGSLGRIVAGDGKKWGMKALSVQTLGSEEALTTTQIEKFASLISGKLDVLRVEKDILGAAFWVRGAKAELNMLEVGGSLVGGLDDLSGTIIVDDAIGTATFRGDIVGGAGEHSGKLHSDESIASLTIAGKIRGGDGDSSGRVETIIGTLGKLSIGAVEGGRGKFSGILVGDFTEAVKPPQTAGGGEGSGRVIDGYAAGPLPTHNYEKPKPPKPWMPGNEVICLCSQNNTHVSIPNPWVNEPYKTPWGETLTRITATLRP